MSDDVVLNALDENTPDIAALSGPLTEQFNDDPDSVELQVRVLRDSLAEKNQLRELVELYRVMAGWHSTNRPWRKVALSELNERLGEDPLFGMYLGLCQLESPRIRVHEALRRLALLADLAAGVYVFEKKWGFGTVTEVRHDDQKVVVDFANKPNHEMAFSFASEVLQTIGEDHLFARKHLDTETFEQLVKEDPAEVVRIALRSFGPISAPRIQSIVVPDLVPEAKWKTFWANARKGLKQDPLVIIPTKRNDPIELLETEKSFDEAWFNDLETTRSMEHILQRLEELLDGADRPEISEEWKEIIGNRLRFVITGAEGKHHDYCVRAWLIARELGLDPESLNLGGFLEKAVSPAGLLNIVQSLPAKLTKELFAALAERDEETTCEVLLQILPQLEYSALNEGISLLFSKGNEERVATVLRKGWNQWEAEVDVMYWLSTNKEKVTEWNYGKTPDLVARLLKVVNRDYAGARLRVQNQLRELFRQPAWLKGVLESMDEQQRRAFTQGVKDSTAWEQLDKASVLGQIVKIDGSVQDIVSGRNEEALEARRLRVTSYRSFKARQEQLDKIINTDIPANSKEIAVARSYGDLRENFEYKAAKDTQRLLMQRKAELEAQLRDVKPTDFRDFTADEAGMATRVTVQRTDGSISTYTILGEWDSDAEKNILSSGSALAKAVTGSVVGDQVELPADESTIEATVTAIESIDEDMLVWLATIDD